MALKDTKAYKWLDNYWYHYKWRTIIITFLVVVVAISTIQMATKTDSDVNLLYTGPHYFAVSEIHEIELAFEQVMTQDSNGDGVRSASLQDISLMTEDQIKQAKAEADEMGVRINLNSTEMAKAQKQFNTQIFAGEASICLLDPYWFAQVRDSGGFMKISEVLGEERYAALDESAKYDEYGVSLFATDFGKYFTAFANLPEDTVLCIRTVSTASVFSGRSKAEARHDASVQVMRDVLNFTLPEGWTPPAAEG